MTQYSLTPELHSLYVASLTIVPSSLTRSATRHPCHSITRLLLEFLHTWRALPSCGFVVLLAEWSRLRLSDTRYIGTCISDIHVEIGFIYFLPLFFSPGHSNGWTRAKKLSNRNQYLVKPSTCTIKDASRSQRVFINCIIVISTSILMFSLNRRRHKTCQCKAQAKVRKNCEKKELGEPWENCARSRGQSRNATVRQFTTFTARNGLLSTSFKSFS